MKLLDLVEVILFKYKPVIQLKSQMYGVPSSVISCLNLEK